MDSMIRQRPGSVWAGQWWKSHWRYHARRIRHRTLARLARPRFLDGPVSCAVAGSRM